MNKLLITGLTLVFLLGLVAPLIAQEEQWEVIANSELWNTRENYGHGGSGRRISGGMNRLPSYNYPGGCTENPLWASSMAVLAYEPGLNITGPGGSPDYVGTFQVYRRLDVCQTPVSISSRWAHPNSEYKEPFITETEIKSKTGIRIKLTSYSWSYDYKHTNDLILLKYVLTNEGDLVAETAEGTVTFSDNKLEAFVVGMVYDYDITITLNPNAMANFGGNNVDDTAVYAWVDGKLTGVSAMTDADNPGTPGNDYGINSNNVNKIWTGLWLGFADVACLEGADAGPGAPMKKTIWGGPSIGYYRSHAWWAKPEAPAACEDWYRYAMSAYLESYPGDPGQPQNKAGNHNFFQSAPETVPFTQWVPKPGVETADPWTLGPTAPDPFTGSDRKDMTAPGEDHRFYGGFGPFSLDVGESMTLWVAEVVGVGPEGIYETAKRAREIFQSYDPATDEFNIPTPPPAPRLTVTATDYGTVVIEWEDNAEKEPDPRTGNMDFAGYKLYRSQVFPPYNPRLPADPLATITAGYPGNTVMADFGIQAVPDSIDLSQVAGEAAGGFWGPYVQIANWPGTTAPKVGGKYHYEDKQVITGFRYWYYVAAYDDEGYESFYTMNANGADGLWHDGFPFRGEAVQWVPGTSVTPTVAVAAGPENVIVVPNPYKEEAAWDIKAEHTIQFRNIPVPCTIEIYDVAGVLVDRVEVPKGQESGIASWDMLNYNNMEVASGLYIYRVVTPGGKDKIGKFAIIR